jgi:CBS domain-containing protein
MPAVLALASRAHAIPRAAIVRARAPRRRAVRASSEADAVETSTKKGSARAAPRQNVAVGGHNPTGGASEMDEARVVDPYGLVEDVMTAPAATLTPELELEDPTVVEFLERYKGVPVASAESGECVGVLSRRDVEKLKNGEKVGITVEDIMSHPPFWCVVVVARLGVGRKLFAQSSPLPSPPPPRSFAASDRTLTSRRPRG